MPNTPKRTRSFVCAMSYYRQFIPRFAELSKMLMDLASLHPKQFKWDNNHTLRFRKMIKALIDNSSLYLPKPNEPFYVQTDASNLCGAGRVYQLNEAKEEMIIACISRTFTRAERKYGAFKKEVLALLYTLRSLDFFLRHAPKLIILVDAKAIVFLRICKDSSGILLRFSLELSTYNAEVHHVAGTNNFISDILSRHHEGIDDIISDKKKIRYLSEQQSDEILNRLTIPHGKKFSKEEVAYMMEAESLIDPIPKKPKRTVNKPGKRSFPNLPKTLHERKIKMPRESFRRPGLLLPTCSCTSLQKDECDHPTINYEELKVVSKILVGGQIDTQVFSEMQKADPMIQNILNRPKLPKLFSFQQNILMFGVRTKKPVLPCALLDLLIQSKHFTVFGLHNSISRMTRDIRKQYYVHQKTLNKKLRFLKNNCLVCQFNKSTLPAHKVKPSNFKRAPQVCWSIDIIPNMPKTSNGYSAILLAVDTFTGYVNLAPMKSRSTEDIMEALRNAVFNPFQIPHMIRSDNETGMANSKEFFQFLQDLNVRFEPTSTAAPWGNGAAERAVQTIKAGMRKFLMQENLHQFWDKFIPFITDAHNFSTSVYGYAPAELQFGSLTPRSHDLIQLWPAATNPEEYIKLILPIAEKSRQLAKEASKAENERVLTYRNKNRATKTFQIGEVVLQKQLQASTGVYGGMKPKFTGPYVIVALDKHGASAIIENLTTARTTKAHFTNLQLFSYHPSFAKLPNNFEKALWENMPEKFSKEKYSSENKKVREVRNGEELNKSEEQLFEENFDDVEKELEEEESAHLDFDPQREKYFSNPKKKEKSCTNEKLEYERAKSTIVESNVEQMLISSPTEQNFQNEKDTEFENKCLDHPENCQCSVNTSEEYGYRSSYVFDPLKKAKKSNLKKVSKYGPFIIEGVRPAIIHEKTGEIDQQIHLPYKPNPFYTKEQITSHPYFVEYYRSRGKENPSQANNISEKDILAKTYFSKNQDGQTQHETLEGHIDVLHSCEAENRSQADISVSTDVLEDQSLQQFRTEGGESQSLLEDEMYPENPVQTGQNDVQTCPSQRSYDFRKQPKVVYTDKRSYVKKWGTKTSSRSQSSDKSKRSRVNSTKNVCPSNRMSISQSLERPIYLTDSDRFYF